MERAPGLARRRAIAICAVAVCAPEISVTNFLSLLCALAMLAGAVVFSHQAGDRVSFVELGAAAPPHASAAFPA